MTDNEKEKARGPEGGNEGGERKPEQPEPPYMEESQLPQKQRDKVRDDISHALKPVDAVFEERVLDASKKEDILSPLPAGQEHVSEVPQLTQNPQGLQNIQGGTPTLSQVSPVRTPTRDGSWRQTIWNGIKKTPDVAKKTLDVLTGNNPLVRGYRSWRERNGWSKLDAAARTVVTGGGTGAYVSNALFHSAAVQNALALGGVASTSMPYVGLWPAALPGLRWAFAWKHHKRVHTAFTNALQKCTNAQSPEEVQVACSEFGRELEKSYKQLINTSDEQALLIAFHNSEVAAPSKTPFLGTEKMYAEHCFTKFVELCTQASESGHVPGVSGQELQALKEHHLTAETIANPAAKEKLQHLMQASVAYARLLANQHRDKREGQITGGVVSSSLVASGLTLNPLPLAIGGLYLGGRFIYRRGKAADQHLEVGPQGELRGKGNTPLLAPETVQVKGGSLYRPEILSSIREEGQLNDAEKRWLPRIVLPAFILSKKFRTPDELALLAAPHVQTLLGEQKGLPPSVDVEEKELRKAAWERERTRTDALENELRQLDADIDSLESELQQADAESRGTGEGERAEDRRERALARAEALRTQIAKKQSRANRLCGNDGAIAQQKQKEDQAKDEYDKARKPKAPDQPMGTVAVGENIEIAKAFSVKVHQIFVSLKKEGGSVMGWFGKQGMNAVTSAPAKTLGKHAALMTATASLYGGAAATLFAYIPGLSAFVSPTVAGTVGVGLGVFHYLKGLIKK